MKIVGILNGVAAFRECVEEYIPKNGTWRPAIIELVRSTYSFQVFPIVPPGHQASPALAFGEGMFSDGEESFGVSQLVMDTEGDVAVAPTTDNADKFLNDLLKLLDDNLGFRLQDSKIEKYYVSNIVFEFDGAVEKYVKKIHEISSIINRHRPERPPVNIKRLAFGLPDIAVPPNSISTAERADFMIERRANRPFDENRYYSSAPMTTQEHIRVLEEIEEALR